MNSEMFIVAVDEKGKEHIARIVKS